MQTPGTQGKQTLLRVAIVAEPNPNTGTLKDKDKGVNLAGYGRVMFQAIPIDTASPPPDPSKWSGVNLGTSDPTFSMWFWNDEMGLWVLNRSFDSPVATLASPAPAAGVPIQVDAYVDGQVTLVTLKNAPTSSQGVAFFVAAHRSAELL